MNGNMISVAKRVESKGHESRDGLQSHGVNVVSGSLNPQFVEWMMGFPQDWTAIKDEWRKKSKTESTD